MEISYRREAKHNYLVAEMPEETAGYEARMLAGNEIHGLLRMHIRYQDGSPFYCYDITSRQPLGRLLETRCITRDEICQLLIQMHAALTEMEAYLLNGGGLLLEPEYIYVEPELFQTGLCLIPGQQGDFQERLSRLLQYILKRVNHKDRECVVLAYGLYQESLKENCGMEDLLGLIAAERQKSSEAQKGSETRKKESAKDRSPGKAVIYEQKEEDTKPAAAEALQSGRSKLPLAGQAFMWGLTVIALPAALWLFKGKETVIGMMNLLAAIDGGLLLILAVFDIWQLKGRKTNTGEETVPEDDAGPWRILYEDDEDDEREEDERGGRCSGGEARDLRQEAKEPGREEKIIGRRQEPLLGGAEERFQTVLLSEKVSGDEGLHRLGSLSDSEEDITVLYYPFVIGKHRDLADYVLSRETVSRFHLRIDEADGRYTITDLNSTNGTKVRGRLLEANETADIQPGDQVCIADLEYIFY